MSKDNNNSNLPDLVIKDMTDKGEIPSNRKKAVRFITASADDLKKSTPQTLEKSILDLLNGPKGSVERLAYSIDPNQYSNFSGLYRRKMKLLPDYILKRISIQDPLVASILLARGNQMAAFGRPQPSRDSTGYKIEVAPSYTIDLSEEKKTELRNKIADAEAKILTCGNTHGIPDHEVPNFSEWMYLQAKNALTFGRIATEIVYKYSAREGKKFHSFRVLDSGTIYPANKKLSEGQQYAEQVKRLRRLKEQNPEIKVFPEKVGEYAFYQVINDTPMIGFKDDECFVQNFYPSSDVELGGFPITPLDTTITAVTTHLNIMTHNKLYFQSGRAARGMLVIQSDDIDQDTVAALKQHFTASINSVTNSWRTPVLKVDKQDSVQWMSIDVSGRDAEFQYLSDSNVREILTAFQMSPEELPGYSHLCLHMDTSVWTDRGMKSLDNLLADKNEVSGFKVWTGVDWVKARAFKTGLRELNVTKTSNGLTLKTSPEHRFRVVDESGELCWKQQKDLEIGDTVLVNRKPVPGSLDAVPSYKGKQLTVGMMEVLGWLTGDGSIQVRKTGKIKHSKNLEFYYHPKKEMAIRERHFKIMDEFGLNCKIVNRKYSTAAIEKIKSSLGFKSVLDTKPMLFLYNTEFVDWLLEIGFKSSKEDKSIPGFLYSVPVEHRAAFLKGFFSADGSKDKLETPSISIVADSTREATKQLLMSLGIRTRNCEGTTRTNIYKVEGTERFNKTYIKAPSKLIVKDKHEFYERIGFLQQHKQPNWDILDKSNRRWDKITKSVACAVADKIRALPGITSEQYDSVRHELKDSKNTFRVKSSVKRIADYYGVGLPAWVDDYHQESVLALSSSKELVEMADIEVFDTVHAFMADGVMVHNSRGTNSQTLSEGNQEYVLEAHRDLGIRPLLAQLQNFVNTRLLPLIDPELAKIASFKFLGLDSLSPEKESVRIQQDMAVHMTMNEVLEQVEKKPIEKEFGGDFLLNPQWQAQIDKYVMVGEIMEHFFNKKGASKNPQFQYIRDPFFFQWQQLVSQQQQVAAQEQMQQEQLDSQKQQQAQQRPQQAETQDAKNDSQNQQQGANPPDSELRNSHQSAEDALSKSEHHLSPKQRALLKKQDEIIDGVMSSFKAEAKTAVDDILKIASGSLKSKPKKN